MRDVKITYFWVLNIKIVAHWRFIRVVIMRAPFFIFSDGEMVRDQNTVLFVEKSGQKRRLPVEMISDIFLLGNVDISKNLIVYLSRKGVLIHFFDFHGGYLGTYYPFEFNSHGKTLIKQVEFFIDERKRLDLAIRFVRGATLNMLTVLKYYNRRGKNLAFYIEQIEKLAEQLDFQESQEDLLALEGKIWECYYKSFEVIIDKEDFAFEYRSRKPPHNPLNALISFGNALLYSYVLSEIYKTHLDPRIGYLHSPIDKKLTLHLDLAEVFKPLIPHRVIFSLVNKNVIKAEHFRKEGGGVYLNRHGLSLFSEEFEKKMNEIFYDREKKVYLTYRMLLRREALKLEKHLLGIREFIPFLSRW
jgi:CRISPR-associated protein Cas1